MVPNPASPSHPARDGRARLLAVSRVVAAGLLVLAAVNHARLSFAGAPGALRHAVFTGIDAAVAVLVVRYPRAALAPVVVLAAQQLLSHGRDLAASLGSPGPIDLPSLGVILFFPALIALLIASRRRGTPARR